MSSQRILGFGLMIVGIVLLVFGMNASESVSEQVSEAFTGRFSERTTWYIIGGIALAVIGLLMALFGGRQRRLA